MHTLFVITTADREDPDKMRHNVAFHQGSTQFAETKIIFREKKTEILFRNYNL